MSDLFGNHIVGFPTRRLKYRENGASVVETLACKALYSYFMLQQAIVQNIFPEVQVPTRHAIPRAIACRVGTCTEGKMFCTIACLSLEITVLLPNYIYSHVTYVTRQ